MAASAHQSWGSPVIGVLSVSSTEPVQFTDSEEAIVRFFAAILALSDSPIDTPRWLLNADGVPGNADSPDTGKTPGSPSGE
jgi:hypothetical protein